MLKKVVGFFIMFFVERDMGFFPDLWSIESSKEQFYLKSF